MNSGRNFSLPTTISPTSLHRRRREPAGRSGGIFEAIPGAISPFEFRYVHKPGPVIPNRSSSLQQGGRSASQNTPRSEDRSSIPSLDTENRGVVSGGLYATKDAGSTSLTHSKASTSSFATSQMTECSTGSDEKSRSAGLKQSIADLKPRLKNSAITSGIQNMKGRWEGRRKSRFGGTMGEDQAPLVGKGGMRARASRFLEHLAEESDEEEKKASKHFFGFGVGRRKPS